MEQRTAPVCLHGRGGRGINTVLNHPPHCTPALQECPLPPPPPSLPYPQLSPRRLPHQGLLNALLLRCRSVRCLPMAVHRAGTYRPSQLRQYGFGGTDPVTERKRGGRVTKIVRWLVKGIKMNNGKGGEDTAENCMRFNRRSQALSGGTRAPEGSTHLRMRSEPRARKRLRRLATLCSRKLARSWEPGEGRGGERG